VSAALWVAESSRHDETARARPGAPVKRGGYLTAASAARFFPRTVAMSLFALFSMDKPATRTRAGGILNVTWCLFALIWIASFTANLAQVLIVATRSVDIASLDEMDRRRLTACVTRGAAYARHMPELYPHIRLVEIDPRFPGETVAKLKSGECDAYVDSYVDLELFKGLPQHCGEDLTIPADPLPFGDIDMAVGVREDLVDVRDALSYWITKLRFCSSTDEDPACRGKWNVADMWHHWAEDHCVDDAAAFGREKRGQIGLAEMALPLFAVGACAVAVLAYEATRPRFREWLRARRTGPDGALLATLGPSRADPRWWRDGAGGVFDMDAFLDDVERGAARDALLAFYLRTDTAAWARLRDVLAALAKIDAAVALGAAPEGFAAVRAPAVADLRALADRAAHEVLVAHKVAAATSIVDAAAPRRPSLMRPRSLTRRLLFAGSRSSAGSSLDDGP